MWNTIIFAFSYWNIETHFVSCVISTAKLSILFLMLSSEKPCSLPVVCNTFELDTHNKYDHEVA